MALNRDWQIKEAATYWQNKANKEAQKRKKYKQPEPVFKYEYDKMLWQSGRWPYPKYEDTEEEQ